MLRFASIGDVRQILEIYRPYVETTTISFETSVPSLAEMQSRITTVLVNYPWLVLERDNTILGYAYASKHRERAAYRWDVDVSVYVKEDCRGGGIGKRLYTALFKLLQEQGYTNAYAIICLPNDASIGLHESLGFKKIAHFSKVGYKFGAWVDTGWWELFLSEHVNNPKEPMLIREGLFQFDWNSPSVWVGCEKVA